jgi:hypothetical protein
MADLPRVKFWRFRNNEHWHGCDFVRPDGGTFRSYGQNPTDAENRMFQILDDHYGKGAYLVEHQGEKEFTSVPFKEDQ